MSVAETQITYEEKQELGYLERLLVGRVSGITYVVLLCSTVIALGLALFHIYVAAFGTPEGRSFRSVHLTGMLILAFFSFPLFRKSIRDPVFVEASSGNALRLLGFAIDLMIVGLIIFIQLWTIWDIDAFHLRYGEKELPDLIVGGILLVLVLEATRRAVGWAMVLITGFFVIHSLYANLFLVSFTVRRCGLESSSMFCS